MTLKDIITCIQSASDDVELSLKYAPISNRQLFRRLRFKLSSLKVFVLSARALGRERNLRSFLERIEDTVQRNSRQIHPHCLQLDGKTDYLREHMDMFFLFSSDIESLKDEIGEWYVIIMLGNYSCSTSAHQVLEMITSFLKNVADFRSLKGLPHRVPLLIDTMEALEQQMSFLKSLTRFASMRCVVEPLEDLSAHTEAVAINASYLLFRFRSVSFYYNNCEELKSEMSVLVQKLKPIDSHVYGAYTQVLLSSKSRSQVVDDYDDVFPVVKDFLDSLISDLWDVLRLNKYSVSMKDLQELYEGLRSIRTIFKEQQLEIKKHVGDFLCDAGILISTLHHAQGEVDLVLGDLLDTIRSILIQIGAKESQISTSIKMECVPAGNEEEEETRVEEGHGSQEVILGFRDDQRRIVDQLTWGSKKLQIIAIVGMAGLGKTTLATSLYTNSSILHYFSVRAWTPISQLLDIRKVLQELLNQIDSTKCSEIDLSDRVRKCLKGRRYLIFLDDVWDAEVWDLLKESFPDDHVGSRIILTSRRHDVVPHSLMVDNKPHFLRELSAEESMKLLQRKLSTTLPFDLRMDIAEKCRGLPLIIVIVAGIIEAMEPEDWNEVVDCLKNISSTDAQCWNAVELSYQHLPPHLRPCLLYLGTFPEDEEVRVRKLVRLWIAEGFVRKDDGDKKSLEDVAEAYLNDLIARSLLMVAKQRSDGGVQTCRIHDLLRDFCLRKAKDVHIFHFMKGFDDLSAFNELDSGLHRLCIQSAVQHFKQSKLFCPRARSLIFNSSESFEMLIHRCPELQWFDIKFTILTMKFLTVLDLEQVDLGSTLPTEIRHLVQLAFLAIRCNNDEMPQIIGDLSNLQTFIMWYEKWSAASFPRGFWNLQKLQYFFVKSCQGDSAGCLINLESSSTLQELERLYGAVIFFSDMDSVLRKFPNIRKLKFILSCCGEDDHANVVVPEVLSHLESLVMIYKNRDAKSPAIVFNEFGFPAHLKKLTLKRFKLSWKNLSIIGELPNLEALKLQTIDMEGDTWEMEEGEFQKLKILKLFDLELKGWITESDDHCGCLEKLIMEQCWFLEELPSCLEEIPTLEVIEVSASCNIVDAVRQIEARRKELMGDSSLKIIIR